MVRSKIVIFFRCDPLSRKWEWPTRARAPPSRESLPWLARPPLAKGKGIPAFDRDLWQSLKPVIGFEPTTY